MSSDLSAELGEKLARLEDLKDDLAKQIDAIREIQARAAKPGSKPSKSNFLRVAEFLVSNSNRPRSARAILKATGITRSSLSQILYRTHRDYFVSSDIPGFNRKKRWALTAKASEEVSSRLASVQIDLFGAEEGEFSGIKAADCCARILKDHGNEPMNALTLAREAIQRGYRGFKVRGPEDEVLLTNAKSFWAALGRDSRFQEVRPLVFILKELGEKE
jgi:hypothetical protein